MTAWISAAIIAANMAMPNTVSRVIYSEASPICSSEERYLVASVIKNRINHPGFGNGKLHNMTEVVLQKGAFSCVNDSKNSNWKRSLTVHNKAMKLAIKLSTVDFKPYSGIVYYHDKSISKPKSWDNKYWKAIKVKATKHFIFYRIVPNTSTLIEVK
jgi:spore germination cell wall hydrolase CwlJ-like protein